MTRDDSLCCSDCGAPITESGVCLTCLMKLGLEGGAVTENSGLLPDGTSRLGEYELLEQVGRGGMGVVFRAQQASLNRDVALKVITTGALAAPEVIDRFRMEAESTAGMEHPNIVTVYEVGESGGHHFLSMRLVEGGTLAERVHEFQGGEGGREQRTRLRKSVTLIGKVARAAAYAHQRGILHRDIKPGNILLDAGGEPFLADFGLAKVLEDQNDMTLTLAVLGTPAYMSPEQAEGRTQGLSTGSDVYSLGIVLYELMVGEVPFSGTSAIELLKNVVDRNPRKPSAFNSAIDRDLETICLKCLEKNPEHRYRSATALAEDLDNWLEGKPIEARPAGTVEKAIKWIRRRPVAAALIGVSVLSLVTIGVGGALYNLNLQNANNEIARRADEQKKTLIQITEETGMRYFEEGDYFAALPWFISSLQLEAGDGVRESLHRRRIGVALRSSPELIRIWRHEQPARESFFSADGARTVIFSDEGNTVEIFDTFTGERRLPAIPHEGGFAAIALSSDNEFVATVGADKEVRILNLNSGEPVGNSLAHDEGVVLLSFTPDNKEIVSVSRGGEVGVWEVSSGKKISRTSLSLTVEVATVDKDGANLAVAGPNSDFASSGPKIKILNMKTGVVVVGGHKVEPGTFASPKLRALKGKIHSLEFNKDGRLLMACTDEDFRILRSETGDPASDVVSHAARDKQNGSLLSSLFSSGESKLTASVVSPGGPVLATSFDDGVVRVRKIASGEPLFAPLEHRNEVRDIQYSPDGRFILSCGDDRTAMIWSARTGKRVGPPLRHFEAITSARFSSDGTMVLTTSRSETRIWSLVTGFRLGPVIATKGARRIAFSKEGRELIVLGSSNELSRWDLATGRETGTVAGLDRNELPPNPIIGPRPPNSDPTGMRELVIKGHLVMIREIGAGEGSPHTLEHRGNVTFARFSEDGSWILTGSEDGKGRVWDARTGRPVTPELAGDSAVTHGILSGDGNRVAMMTDGLWVGSWDFSPDPRPLSELEDLSALLSGHGSNEGSGISPLEQGHAPGLEVLSFITFPAERKRNAWVWNSALQVALVEGLPAADGILDLSATSGEANLLKAQFAAVRFSLLLAKSHLNDILKETPDDAFVHGLLGAFYRDVPFSAKAKGEIHYQKALAAEPQRSSYWEGLGRVQLDLKKLDEAEKSLRKSLEIDPGNASAMEALGDCFIARENWNQALEQFRQVATVRRQVLARDGGGQYSASIPPRDPKASAAALDLTDFYSNPPDCFPGFEEIPGKGISAIPRGLLTLGEVEFDARGAIISGNPMKRRAVPHASSVKGIPILRKCDRIHLLHTVQRDRDVGGWIAKIEFTYADGTKAPQMLKYGEHARDCYYGSSKPLLDPNSKVVWDAGQDVEEGNPRAYLTTIENPHPEKEMVMMSISDFATNFTWVLFAITVE